MRRTRLIALPVLLVLASSCIIVASERIDEDARGDEECSCPAECEDSDRDDARER